VEKSTVPGGTAERVRKMVFIQNCLRG
jgi:hypothetical protein